MIDSLKLRRPIYRQTAAFGHFGRTEPSFTWEATDKAEALREGSRAAVARTLSTPKVLPGTRRSEDQEKT